VTQSLLKQWQTNSAYLGTDENGQPVPPVKSGEDGRYHLTGDLQLAPTAAFKTNVKQVEILLEQSGGARIVILAPVPCYVLSPCCGDRGHITNQTEDDFFHEILSAEKMLTAAAAAGHWTGEAKVIDLCKLFGSSETPIQDLATSDGTSIWAGDGVHLTSLVYSEAPDGRATESRPWGGSQASP
jgi:hypothetical protein